MTQQTQTLTNAARRACPKCGSARATSETKCADCGRALQSVAKIRLLGVFQVVLGDALLAFMIWLASRMYDAAAASKFTGDSQDELFIVFVFGLAMSVCLSAIAAGVWQIIFGKRNKLFALAVLLLLGLGFVGAGIAARLKC